MQEDLKAMICVFREKARKAKGRLGLKLSSAVSDKKKGFLKYVKSKKF